MCETFFFIEDMAEILSKKEINGKNIYYIHYEDCKCTLKIHCESQIWSRLDFAGDITYSHNIFM